MRHSRGRRLEVGAGGSGLAAQDRRARRGRGPDRPVAVLVVDLERAGHREGHPVSAHRLDREPRLLGPRESACASPKSNPAPAVTTFAGRARGSKGSTPLKRMPDLAPGKCTGSESSRRRLFRHTSPIVAIARRVPSVGMSGHLAPLVSMVETADSRMAYDRGVAIRLRGGRSHRRRALAQREVHSVVVVVRDRLGE